MKVADLGKTGFTVSRLALGAAGIGNLYREMSDDDGANVVRTALDHGISLIDTAPLYGRGASERRIGLALRDHPLASQCIVATKVGYVPDDFDYSYDATRRSVEASLERLQLANGTSAGRPRVVVQVHEIRPEIWDVVMMDNGTLGALRDARAEGLISAVSVTGSDVPTLLRAVDTGAFDTVLVWRHYHLLDRSAAVVIRAAADRGMGVVVATPFAGGLLATGDVDDAKYFYRDAPAEERSRAAEIATIASRHQVPLAAVALQLCLRTPGVAAVVAGADTPEHVAENVRSLETAIPDALWSELASGRFAVGADGGV